MRELDERLSGSLFPEWVASFTGICTEDEDITYLREYREFNEITFVAEIARYLNKSCLYVQGLLKESKDGIYKILGYVNEFNELLYDRVIPKLFDELYELREYVHEEEEDVELAKPPAHEREFFEIRANPDLVASMDNEKFRTFVAKSFHLDNYCFASKPEDAMFWTLLHDQNVEKVYFTGMLTHGQTEFNVSYIDPESHTLRTYYPDFLAIKKDGEYVIVEVKRDDMIEDAVVQAKAEYATQMAMANGMEYRMVPGKEAMKGVGIS